MLEPGSEFPAPDPDLFEVPTLAKVTGHDTSRHPPRFLMLYGSLRERSYSRLATLEAARLLRAMGGDVEVFDPTGLPLPDGAPESHPKVQQLRVLATWSEGDPGVGQRRDRAIEPWRGDEPAPGEHARCQRALDDTRSALFSPPAPLSFPPIGPSRLDDYKCLPC